MGSIPPPNIGDLHVSVEDLDAAAAYVERLRQYIDDTISTRWNASRADEGRQQQRPDRSERHPLRRVRGRRHAVADLETSTANMEAHLKTLSQKLAALKEGTEDIAKAFRDTEARNGANGKEIERLLESAAPPPTAGGTPTYPHTA